MTNFLLALGLECSLLDKMGTHSRDQSEGHGAQLAEATAGYSAAEKDSRVGCALLFCFNFINISSF